MKVRMKVDVSGTRDGRAWPKRGGEVELPDAEGAHLCSQGIAEPVAEPVRAERRPAKRAETRKS